MPELSRFHIYTHDLGDAQRALVQRAIEHFHDCQRHLQLTLSGERPLPTEAGSVRCIDVLSAPQPTVPEITITGLPLDDHWYSHTWCNHSVITAADWVIAFDDWADSPPPAAPDAYLLEQIVCAVLLASIALHEEDVAHETTTGCLADKCEHKPDLAIKLRSGFLCAQCRTTASEAGLSGVYVDAIQALLDRIRLLALGRSPQALPPHPVPRNEDDVFVSTAPVPSGVVIPPVLVESLRRQRVTVLVGSGFSLQRDVAVQYSAQPAWRALPGWTDIPQRLADRLHNYRGRAEVRRQPETLREFLVDLDYFRESLGPDLFYPRAVFDIFLPRITSTGLANRLVFRLPLKWVLTTNYDFVLNFAAPAGTPTFTWREARQASEYLQRADGPPPILKLHGCASRADTLILTAREYDGLTRDDAYTALVQRIFADQVTLFLGYGLNDPLDLDMALSSATLAGAAQGDKFALIHQDNARAIRDRFPNVHVISYEAHEDVPAILAMLIRETAR